METKELLSELTTEIKTFKEKTQADLDEKGIDQRELADRLLQLEQSGVTAPANTYNSKAMTIQDDLNTFIRTAGEQKGMSIGGGDSSGGAAVVPFRESGIDNLLRDKSPLRDLIAVRDVGEFGSFEEVVSQGGSTGAWVTETGARPETNAALLEKVVTELFELYAMPVATQRLIDDNYVRLDQWLADQIAVTFAEMESEAFINGTGVNQPLGLTQQTLAATDDGTRPFGTLEYVPSGSATNIDSDALISLFYALKSGYRSNAAWLMNSNTARYVMQMKDSNGSYIWSHGDITNDRPPTLLGRPVAIFEELPDIAADSLSVWVGDFNAGIRFIQRPGINLLPDPYTNKPNVNFYAYGRVGMNIRDSSAIKALKTATS